MAVKEIFNTSAELDLPKVLPTLDLNFANSKTLDPRITFTRASGGSYVDSNGLIKYAGVNEPRFEHNPSTGESLGLLIEESRTNLWLRSEDLLTSPNFSASGLSNFFTSEISSLPAPNGSTTQTVKFVSTETTQQGLFLRQSGLGLTSGTTYTVSAYIYVPSQAGISNWGMVWDYADSVDNTQILNQTVFDRWVRISGTVTLTSTRAFLDFNIRINNFNAPTTAGFTLYLWGAQLEVGAFSTSYIPTVASTVTRSADNASMTGTNFSSWYNSTASTGGTILAQARRGYSGNFSGYPNLYAISDGTSNNKILAYGVDASTQFTNYAINTGGVLQTDYVFATISTTNLFKSIHAFSTNSSTFCVNGTLTTTDTSVTLPSVNKLNIGQNETAGSQWNGTISSLSYYPVRLTNSQLQTLTK